MSDAQASPASTRVSFDLSEQMERELQRVLEVTDLATRPEVFRRAFTLLRIHLDAKREGRDIYIQSRENPHEKWMITLPFNVYPEGAPAKAVDAVPAAAGQ
jgi:hypothetical protein